MAGDWATVGGTAAAVGAAAEADGWLSGDTRTSSLAKNATTQLAEVSIGYMC